MKIGIIIKNYAAINEFSKTGMPTKGGADFHAENQAKQMISLGHNVYIMAKRSRLKLPARELFERIDIVRLHGPIRWLESIVRLVSTHRDTDAFYIFSKPEFSVWVVMMARVLNKPVTLVLTHRDETVRPRTWREKVLCACDRYIAISNEIKKCMIEQMGIDGDKIVVLPQGVDLERFNKPSEIEKEHLREKNDIPKGQPIILFCARIALIKGVDTLQRIWEIVHAKRKDALLLVVGGGHENLVKDIVETGKRLDNSIRIIGEVTDPEPWYKLADLYIFPSRGEGLPTSLMEAIATGLPSITTKVGGCEDLVINENNGYLLDWEDASGMAEKTLYLLENDQVRFKMSEAALDYAVKSLDCNKLKYELEKILIEPKK